MKKMLLGLMVLAAATAAHAKEFALTGIEAAQALKLKPIYQNAEQGLVVIELNDETRGAISKHMHDHGKCGGYELITLSDFKSNSAPFRQSEQQQLSQLFVHMPKPSTGLLRSRTFSDMPEFSQKIADAVAEVSPARLKEDLTWISSYPTRHHASTNKNDHVTEMRRRLQNLAAGRSDVKIEYIDHARTQQKTLRATITGSESPKEIVALGAHFDSTSYGAAPGADDDGSGSANMLEIFRLLMKQDQPKRTIQIFWYAAEEVGLVGSAEVATDYKNRKEDVVSVLQLDMTLFPGSGSQTIAVITDFTNSWLNAYLTELNRLYTKAKFINSQCGYGCSDHASWHRQGFPAAFPFEAAFNQMNDNIHSPADLIDSNSDFEHSATYARLGLAYAMTMANSSHRAPKTE